MTTPGGRDGHPGDLPRLRKVLTQGEKGDNVTGGDRNPARSLLRLSAEIAQTLFDPEPSGQGMTDRFAGGGVPSLERFKLE